MSLVFPFSKGSLVNLPNGNFKKTYTMKTHFESHIKEGFPDWCELWSPNSIVSQLYWV